MRQLSRAIGKNMAGRRRDSRPTSRPITKHHNKPIDYENMNKHVTVNRYML